MVCAPVRRDNPRALARELSTAQAHKTCLYLTCIVIPSLDLAHYKVYLVLKIEYLWIVVQLRDNFPYSHRKLLIWMIVGQGPIALAEGAGGGCLDIFTLLYLSTSLYASGLETPDID